MTTRRANRVSAFAAAVVFSLLLVPSRSYEGSYESLVP